MENDRASRQQELARLMLDKAGQDLKAAELLSSLPSSADEVIGFHIQQAIEKAFKAALTRQGINYQFTHDLLILFEQSKEAGLAPPTDPYLVAELTPFAVQFRYVLYDDPEPLDREQANKIANQYIDWATEIVDANIPPNNNLEAE